MKKLLLFLISIFICSCNSTPEITAIKNSNQFAKDYFFQLATPNIKSESILFEQENQVKLILDLPQTTIHFSLDGTEPTLSSPIFSDEIVLNESAHLKAKAFHPELQPSEIVEAQFIKLGKELPVKNIFINRIANENYLGKGPQGLIDRKKGTTNFKSNEWLGFAGGDLEAVIEFAEKTSFKKITTSLLSDQNAWIFLPKKLEISISDDGKKFNFIEKKVVKPTSEHSTAKLHFSEINFEKQQANFVKILIKNIPSIPEWHLGKGTPSWLFIDEIIIE